MFRVLTLILCLSLSVSLSAAELKVLASKSLRAPLQELSEYFEGKHPGQKVALQFAKSAEVARMLGGGVPADVFLMNEDDFSKLKGKDIEVEKSTIRLLSDEVAIVVPAAYSKEWGDSKDLAAPEIKSIAFYKESSPLANKLREYFVKLGIIDSLSPKFLEMANAKAAVVVLTAGTAQCMFAYAADAMETPGVKIAYKFPASEVAPIVYVVGIAQSSIQKDLGQLYLESLVSTIARRIFENSGYSILIK